MNAAVAQKHRRSDLEDRLSEWAREWGGGRFEDNGWPGVSPLHTLMKYHGRPPEGLHQRIGVVTAADEVQMAVEALEKQARGYAPAVVLRCEYFSSAPKVEKLRRLSRVGLRMSEVRYCQHLRIAKIHVAGWLKLPFSEPLDIDGEIGMLEYLVENEGAKDA